ncbi:unnamed protein product [Angiostrongylus costaricensis]|uniref:MADF domain-containing protein n=1 Tax=Angiostrongylus costaricensis TaxID=334426 RepID=A0A0R3PAL3_ANGCS|nr:unnamed protein product [Angiostrongylus costaricensis]
MSRRKVEPYKRTSLEIASNIERPVWNDTLRGILVALVKDRRALWDFRLRSTQERSMLFFRDIATILSNQDKRMNGTARPKTVTKRNRGRRSSLAFLQGVNKEGISDVSNTKDVIRDELDSGEKALTLDAACKDITIKQEVAEGEALTGEGMEILETNIVEPLLENSVKLTADELSRESSQFAASDVVWSTEMICVLIECVKDVPALWHHNHPDYRNSAKRKEHLVEIAAKLRALPGGAIINEGHVSGKWSILRECFNKQMKKSKQGAVSNWEHYNRLLFLSPEVMSAWKFDDLSGENQQTPVSTSATDVSVDVQNQFSKFLGLVSESVKLKDVDNNPIKKSRIPLEPSESVKPKDAENNTIRKPKMSLEPNTVKVVSTWVPPREDSLDTVLHSLSATPPSATAQVTAKSELVHILQRPSPHLNLNGSKTAYRDFIPDHTVRSHEDKWTLMGRMIEETARELEAKRSELAFRLQKDINDVIFKYQLESLRHQ